MRRHFSLTLGYVTRDEHCGHRFGIVEPSGENLRLYVNFWKNISNIIIYLILEFSTSVPCLHLHVILSVGTSSFADI